MKAFKSFEIVWIDDQFANEKFQSKLQKGKIDWNELFKKKDNKIYRLFDIKFSYLTNFKQFHFFIKDEKKFLNNTFYFFIIDRIIPFEQGIPVTETLSMNIIKTLSNLKKKYHSLEYVILSSAAPESYKIKDIDYYRKYLNEDFTLPSELSDKILFLIKNKINLIDFTEFEYKINTTDKKGEKSHIFPYMDIYKDFVDLQELNSDKENVYYIVTQKGTSDEFIIQNLFVIFFEYIKFFEYKINYFNLIKNNFNDDELLKYFESHQLIILRDNWTKEKFDRRKELTDKLSLNSRYVYIFDENDEYLDYYLECNKRAKIIKINNLKHKDMLVEDIMFLFFDYLLNIEIIKNLDKDKFNKIVNNIYYKHKKLLFHPILYRAIVNQDIYVESLDDSVEIFDNLNKYIKENKNKNEIKNKLLVDCQNNEQLHNNINEEDKINENIFNLVKKIYGEQYIKLLENTIYFWLKNSWNTPYNIKVQKNEEIWREYTYDILKELIKEYNKECKKCKKDEKLELVDNAIKIFEKSKASEQNIDDIELISKIIWPHDEFPMPIYMINEIGKKEKKFYLQDKCMVNLNFTEEIKENYKSVEAKIKYYDHFYKLVQSTKKHFKEDIAKILDNLSKLIKEGEKIEISNENLKKLAETFIRISLAFIDIGKFKKISKESGKLGTFLGMYRGKLLEKLRSEEFIFHIEEKEKKENFCENFYKWNLNCDELKSSQIIEILEFNENKFKEYKGKNIKIYDKEYSKEKIYQLCNVDNKFNFSLLANLTNEFFSNSLKYNLWKHYGALPLLTFLAEYRNSNEHDKDKAIDLKNKFFEEYFKESFIYGYEYIWLMYKHIMDINDITSDNESDNEKVKQENYVVLKKEYLTNSSKETYKNVEELEGDIFINNKVNKENK